MLIEIKFWAQKPKTPPPPPQNSWFKCIFQSSQIIDFYKYLNLILDLIQKKHTWIISWILIKRNGRVYMIERSLEFLLSIAIDHENVYNYLHTCYLIICITISYKQQSNEIDYRLCIRDRDFWYASLMRLFIDIWIEIKNGILWAIYLSLILHSYKIPGMSISDDFFNKCCWCKNADKKQYL